MNKQNSTEEWTKRYTFPFSKKGGLGITKNYRDVSFTAKVYIDLLLNDIWLEIVKILSLSLSLSLSLPQFLWEIDSFDEFIGRKICFQYKEVDRVSLFLMAYQPSWVIQCKNHLYRRTVMKLFNLPLQREIKGFMHFQSLREIFYVPISMLLQAN